MTLLQLSAHAGQTGLQAGRAVVEQHLDLGVAYAEAVRVADGGGEQAQPLVYRQGRVDARLADVRKRTGEINVGHEGSSFGLCGWIDGVLYIVSIVILYIRRFGVNRIFAVSDTGGTRSVLRLDAADGILKTGLLARLFCVNIVLFRAVAQRFYIDQQNTRQRTLAVLEFADVDGIALVLIDRQTADIL